MVEIGNPVTFFAIGYFILMTRISRAAPQIPRPKLIGNAIPQRDLDPKDPSTQKRIVLIHNFFRSRVDPPASNMLEMNWHREAQEDAQRWAEACQLLVHDNTTGRWVEEYGSCGQNIFVSNLQVPWFFAIKVWFMEQRNFTYGRNVNDLSVVGHYTQMIWYSTHKVGCGFHYCGPDVTSKPFYNYVCNYCPIGNYPDRFHTPYDKGEPCSSCTDSCKYKKLCTNGCEYADLWMNCRELNSTWHEWLCRDGNKTRERACRATCRCDNKIR